MHYSTVQYTVHYITVVVAYGNKVKEIKCKTMKQCNRVVTNIHEGEGRVALKDSKSKD